jgi:hypothetical protein
VQRAVGWTDLAGSALLLLQQGIFTMMMRRTIAGLLVLLFAVGASLAKDSEVKGKVIKVDVAKKTLTIQTKDGAKKVYEINDKTKFLGPRGGVSDLGLRDDRVTAGAEVKLIVAGNNRTLREVHLPVRKKTKAK